MLKLQTSSVKYLIERPEFMVSESFPCDPMPGKTYYTYMPQRELMKDQSKYTTNIQFGKPMISYSFIYEIII